MKKTTKISSVSRTIVASLQHRTGNLKEEIRICNEALKKIRPSTHKLVTLKQERLKNNIVTKTKLLKVTEDLLAGAEKELADYNAKKEKESTMAVAHWVAARNKSWKKWLAKQHLKSVKDLIDNKKVQHDEEQKRQLNVLKDVRNPKDNS